MFYTKYRPQIFSEISRPNEAADVLAKQIARGKTVHAYLFVGPRGTGKTSTARILAKALNCEKTDKKGDPCDKCESCNAIRLGSYLDLIEIDAASNRGIDDIRDLRSKVKLAPTVGNNKIYIIDEVHMLTNEAFNALLKTLEEPPKNTVFILCTTELHKVPDTIKSRCQLFKFRRATIKQLVTKLSHIVEVEGLTVEEKDLKAIARASLGGFRDAETMLQQVAEGEITVASLLSFSDKEAFIDFCDFLMKKQATKALTSVNKAFDEGIDLYVWCGEFIKYIRDLLLLKSGVSLDVLELPDELVDSVKQQAVDSTIGWLIYVSETFADAQNKIKSSFIPQFPLELAVAKVCNYQARSEELPVVTIPRPPTTSGLKKGQDVEKTSASMSDKSESSVSEEIRASVTVDLDGVSQKWTDVITKIDGVNKTVLGLIKACRPTKLDGQYLVLEVFYAFHKERLEAPKNRTIVENVLSEIYGEPLLIKCELSDQKPEKLKEREVGVLTDFNVVAIDKDAVIDMLDGGLPL